MKRLPLSLKVAVGVVMAGAVGVAASAAVAQNPGFDFGPDTCLVGFVWRAAVPRDFVCVEPQVRAQAAADNAQAAARVDPNSAPSCLLGYVWREAVPSDRVCVTPDVRSRTRQDNALASARRNSVRLIVTPLASGNFRVAGDHINQGVVRVILVSTSGFRSRHWLVPTRPSTLRPGGFINFVTHGPLACAAGGPPNSYFYIRDPISRRTSRRQYVRQCVRID